MKELCVCELCGSGRDDWVLSFKTGDALYGSPGTFAVYECQNCGLAFLSPQPGPEETKNIYPPANYYAHRVRALDYNKLKIDLCIAVSSPIKSFHWAFNHSRIPFVKPSILRNYNARFLDVGCGDARFLRKMRVQTHLRLYGLDPLLPGNVFIDGVDLFRGTLMEASYPSEYFDVVRLNHVLEHLPDPREVFKELHRVLRSDGQVIITVPNSSSLARMVFGHSWVGWDVPRHLFHYTPRTLKHFAEATGFAVCRLRHDGTSFDWARSLASRYSYGRCEITRSRIRRSLFFNLLFTPLALTANMFQFGDCITAILQKP